jgi:hypothetical protein
MSFRGNFVFQIGKKGKNLKIYWLYSCFPGQGYPQSFRLKIKFIVLFILDLNPIEKFLTNLRKKLYSPLDIFFFFDISPSCAFHMQ